MMNEQPGFIAAGSAEGKGESQASLTDGPMEHRCVRGGLYREARHEMKCDLAGIARQALLSFPGAALGAMLPSEQEAVIKIMTHLQEEAWEAGFERGYRDRVEDEADESFFRGPTGE